MESLLDKSYTYLINRRPFFESGWGEQDAISYFLREDPREFHLRRPANDITLRWGPGRIQDTVTIREGWFESPYHSVWDDGRYDYASPEMSQARIQMILPRPWKHNMPVVVHFAGTGDQGFARRRIAMAMPLAERGIGSVILENPFYGTRRPPDVNDVRLREVSDMIRMLSAAVEEGIALVHRLKADGYGPLGVTGISMGGSVALTVAAQAGLPLAVGACVAPHSASAVYLDGAFNQACAWDALNEDMPEGNAANRMRDLMDFWDIRNYPLPARPDATVLLGALRDSYIPRYSVEIVHEHWQGSSLKWIDTGHLGAFFFYRRNCYETVIEAFRRLG